MTTAPFLTPAWVESLGAAAAASDDVREATGGVDLTIQHVVVDGPDGRCAYWVRIDHGSVSSAVGEAEAPDVTFTEDYATAAAVVRAELTVPAAFLAGRIRAAGDLGLLLRHRQALAGLEAAFAAVRRDTVVP